ncbi:MAG TPA: beta-propeller fold lactonase family protein [Terriglobales bacterium]|nr:beta-propeller fold lactonase family protein [Terriglobales bacterium]
MSVVRAARAVAATIFSAVLFVICTSCGETYRPVAFPIPPTAPSPGAANTVFVLSANGPNDPGAMSRIDVSGDSYLNANNLGVAPVHAALLPSGNILYAANNANDTISASSVSSSGNTATTISLPAGSLPVFVHTTENSRVYAANYGFGTVSAINTATNVVNTTISVNPSLPNNPATPDTTLPKPVALAETPDGKKLYVANFGVDYLTSINTVDFTRNPAIVIGGTPVAVAARSDSKAVFALDSNFGNVYALDPTIIPEPLSLPVPTGAGADFMLYDGKLNRLYVLKSGYVNAASNSSGNALWVFDAASSITNTSSNPPTITPPTLLAGPISISAAAGSPCGTGAPVPVSMTALADGSRIYVASYQINGSTICSQVDVFNTSSYVSTKTIPTGSSTIDNTNPTGCAAARPSPPGQNGPAGFRLSITGAADLPSSRIYLANCDAGAVTVITTVAIPALGSQPAQSADTVVSTLAAPESVFKAVGGAPLPPPQNPMFIFGMQ